MKDHSTDQKKTERKIENDAKLEEEEEIHQSVEEEDDDWEKIDHQSQSEKEEEEDWEKISHQSEKIDDQSENDVEVEIDEEEQEVKEEEEEEEGMKIEGEKIDDESEKIDGESEKIDDEKMETDDEEEEEEKKGENRYYWNRDWDHWIYRREGINKADFPSCCSYGPVSIHDPFTWQAAILGPPGSPYEDGVFFLTIDLPPDYPNSPPTIVFKTKVFHPNIDEDGKIYVNILEEEEWKPIQTIESLLLSICSLLAEPDPVDPTFESCYLFRYDWESYFNKARECTRTYAM